MSKSKQILIVDDEPNVRLVFRTTLESEGLDLFEAENGRAALDWLETSKADLVLLDLQMPGHRRDGGSRAIARFGRRHSRS